MKRSSEARRMLDTLMPFVERGVPVVGLEPSCLLSLRDEFLHYGFGEEARKLSESGVPVRGVSGARESGGAPAVSPLKPLGSDTRVGARPLPSEGVRRVSPGADRARLDSGAGSVSTVESSCCGMAGSFGYEAEHYEASKAMAELSLLPAVRKAAQCGVIVADGTSCRHQIHDGAAATRCTWRACWLLRLIPDHRHDWTCSNCLRWRSHARFSSQPLSTACAFRSQISISMQGVPGLKPRPAAAPASHRAGDCWC